MGQGEQAATEEEEMILGHLSQVPRDASPSGLSSSNVNAPPSVHQVAPNQGPQGPGFQAEVPCTDWLSLGQVTTLIQSAVSQGSHDTVLSRI